VHVYSYPRIEALFESCISCILLLSVLFYFPFLTLFWNEESTIFPEPSRSAVIKSTIDENDSDENDNDQSDNDENENDENRIDENVTDNDDNDNDENVNLNDDNDNYDNDNDGKPERRER
jgi:hypothetical protein